MKRRDVSLREWKSICGGVGGFSHSLYRTTLCSGFLEHSPPVSWLRRGLFSGLRARNPSSGHLSSSTSRTKVTLTGSSCTARTTVGQYWAVCTERGVPTMVDREAYIQGSTPSLPYPGGHYAPYASPLSYSRFTVGEVFPLPS